MAIIKLKICSIDAEVTFLQNVTATLAICYCNLSNKSVSLEYYWY